VSGLVSSLQGDGGLNRFQRVVLVPFPHPGSRALAFVTRSLKDEATDRTILCVCLLTGVVPPAGFTLFVPEEEVTEIQWTVDQTLQAILTGGLTAPSTIGYFPMNADVSGPSVAGASPTLRADNIRQADKLTDRPSAT